MEKQLVLLDTKKEYIEHLLDVFTILIAKRIYKIFNENEMNVKKFQEELVLIKIWNNNKVVDEYNEIIKKSKCNYLEKLLNKIVYLDIKIKLEFNVKDNISIIKPCDFIHKCLINSAVFCWKNVYLFSSKNLKPSEKQYHLNLIEKNIRKIIKNTIRNIIPYETILNLYEEQKEKERLNAEKKLGGDEETDESDDETDEDEEETDEDEEETEESDDEDETDESDEEDDEETEEEEIQTGIPINVEVNNLKEEKESEVNYLKELIEEENESEEEVETKELIEEVKESEVEAKEKKSEEEVKINEVETTEVIEEVKVEINEAKEAEADVKDDLESLLEDDNDFIDTSIFKKKKKEKSKKIVSSDEEYDEESDLDIEIENNEDIKKINISSINKKNRH